MRWTRICSKASRYCCHKSLQEHMHCEPITWVWPRNIAKQTYTCKNCSLLPDEVGKDIDYNLRNSQDIQLPKISKNYFFKSYIPSTIRLWNELTEIIQSIAEVDTFKTNLKQIFGKMESYKPYLVENTEGHIHLSRIQMKLRGLNSQREKTPHH